jgi:hypothetical protein
MTTQEYESSLHPDVPVNISTLESSGLHELVEKRYYKAKGVFGPILQSARFGNELIIRLRPTDNMFVRVFLNSEDNSSVLSDWLENEDRNDSDVIPSEILESLNIDDLEVIYGDSPTQHDPLALKLPEDIVEACRIVINHPKEIERLKSEHESACALVEKLRGNNAVAHIPNHDAPSMRSARMDGFLQGYYSG